MPIDVVDLSGVSRARGKLYGRVRRMQVQACLSEWLESLRTAGVGEPTEYMERMLHETDFLPAIQTYCPDLLEEVGGIAEGAEVEFDQLLASQFMDEEWAYRQRTQRTANALERCSSIAIRARQGLTWIGQNMDLGGYTDRHQVIMRIAPCAGEPGALIFTIGGMIALMGVNSHRVGVCVNSLPALPAAGQGLPVAFVIRMLLRVETVDEAASVIRALPHATGQHYLVADDGQIKSFEASPVGVAEYRSPNPARVLHTNHPLAAESSAISSRRDQTDSKARLRCLQDRLMVGRPELELIRAALCSSDDADHPVCKTPNPAGRVSAVTGMTSFTTGSMISVLDSGSRDIESWVSAGPPSVRGYCQIRLYG
jgi:isopenicillin-N N-acyltransferase like protein